MTPDPTAREDEDYDPAKVNIFIEETIKAIATLRAERASLLAERDRLANIVRVLLDIIAKADAGIPVMSLEAEEWQILEPMMKIGRPK